MYRQTAVCPVNLLFRGLRLKVQERSVFVHELVLPRSAGNSRFLLRTEQSSTLLILCHGWHGRLASTWGELDTLFYRYPDLFQGMDLLFLGYKRSPASIGLLSTWLEGVIVSVASPTFWTGDRKRFRRTYSNFVLVGHSLGSLAIREAILHIHRKCIADSTALNICRAGRLLLFAPPLLGVDWKAYVAAVQSSYTEWFVRLISLYVHGIEPVAHDLEPNSAFIKNLREQTSIEMAQSNCALPPAHLVLGMHDTVIKQGLRDAFPYPGDVVDSIPAETHTSICKFKFPVFPLSRALELLIGQRVKVG